MLKLPRAVGLALGTLVFAAGSAQAGTYVVTAKAQSFDTQLARKIEAAGGTITARLPQIGVAIVEADEGFAYRAGKISALRSVVPDVVIQFDLNEASEEIQEDFANPPASGDNDTFFDFQWGHKAIDAVGAWNAGYRGNGAVVAVLDSGVYCQHRDIGPNLLTSLSRSFIAGQSYCNVLANPLNGGRNDSTHGTHTSGTILAADNGFGTIGVAPQSKLIAVKVLSATTGGGSFAAIMQGIVYAADAGADVINMSLGVSGGLPVGGNEVAELINATGRATRYANKLNATVVASAGNDGRDLDHDSGRVCDTDGVCTTDNLRAFPAQLPGVLAISALGPLKWLADPANANLDIRASYSNYGQSVIDFGAPGGNFDYPGIETCSLKGIVRACWVFDMVMSTTSGTGGYGWSAGTSMSAPHVSGVAALIVGKNGGEMSPAAVERILRASADDLGKPGNDETFGSGRVNAARAVGN
ncbi:MAG: S8 family serine peptidase [Pseudomonadota bacterium]|nr:S8 family serine peptidase [Pseudomonadota bacterium]